MPETIDTLITGIETSKSDIATAIENKGVTVPSGTKLAGMASLINSISTMHGPASSVDGDIAVFSGTSGDTLADSGKKVTDFVAKENGSASGLRVFPYSDYDSIIRFNSEPISGDPELCGSISFNALESLGTLEILGAYSVGDGLSLVSSANDGCAIHLIDSEGQIHMVGETVFVDDHIVQQAGQNNYTYNFPASSGTLGLQVDIVDLTQL